MEWIDRKRYYNCVASILEMKNKTVLSKCELQHVHFAVAVYGWILNLIIYIFKCVVCYLFLKSLNLKILSESGQRTQATSIMLDLFSKYLFGFGLIS